VKSSGGGESVSLNIACFNSSVLTGQSNFVLDTQLASGDLRLDFLSVSLCVDRVHKYIIGQLNTKHTTNKKIGVLSISSLVDER
jgi:hypothetical protein